MRTATWCRSGTSSLLPDVAAARGAGWDNRSAAGAPRSNTMLRWGQRASAYLQVAPLVLVFGVFLVVPIAAIAVVSVWDYTEYAIVPAFIGRNYLEVFTSAVTYKTYLSTLKFAALTWVFCFAIGFWVAYFLAFHARTLKWQMTLFLLCTIPFWTSNGIRM